MFLGHPNYRTEVATSRLHQCYHPQDRHHQVLSQMMRTRFLSQLRALWRMWSIILWLIGTFIFILALHRMFWFSCPRFCFFTGSGSPVQASWQQRCLYQSILGAEGTRNILGVLYIEVTHTHIHTSIIIMSYMLHYAWTGPAFPGRPALVQAETIRDKTSSTPFPCLTLAKIVGPSPRISRESRSITSSDALTYGARSVYHTQVLDHVTHKDFEDEWVPYWSPIDHFAIFQDRLSSVSYLHRSHQ